MSDTDWVAWLFPGDGLQLPTDQERDEADAAIAEWSARWGEHGVPVPRTYPDVTGEGFANYLAGTPTNRAYLRSRLRRWWRQP